MTTKGKAKQKKESKAHPRTKDSELRVNQMPKEVNQGLHNIAKNLGISFSVYMKIELRKIYEAAPAHLKKPYVD